MEATTSIDVAVEAISHGHLCAIPTETVYGLAANATDAASITRVFVAKGRPVDHPLIVHISNPAEVHHWITELPEWAVILTTAIWPGPLTVVGKRSGSVLDVVTGGQDTVAVRVPNHPMTLSLLAKLHDHDIVGLVAPSANTFGGVSPTTAEHVLHDLGTYLESHGDVVLDGGPCAVGVESTIVLATGDQPIILRPGAVTQQNIEDITGVQVLAQSATSPRVSGSLESHYAPTAQVVLVDAQALISQPLVAHSGLIALADVATPDNFIRLSSPQSPAEFASQLYAALRSADDQCIPVVYVVAPEGTGIEQAIADRLRRAAHSDRSPK